MKKVLAIAVSVLCLAGCKEVFRKYEFDGGFTAPDGFFYELTANFLPTADGCDHIAVSQKGEDGKNIATSGCIVRVGKKNIMKIVHEEVLKPEIRIIMKDGTEFRHSFDFITSTGDSFILMTRPDNTGDYFFVMFQQGKKFGLDLYSNSKGK